MLKKMLKAAVLSAAATGLFASAASAETIIIGHFGNPTPMQLLASSDAVQLEAAE